MSAGALFVLVTAIWGSTWLAIKFQLGVVDPQVSVAYRFALASLLLAGWCVASGRSLRFSRTTHRWLALQGATFFGLNYIAVYVAERYIASGLVAVVFSTIVFMTPIGVRLAFGTPLRARTLAGAALGVSGVALLFLPELRAAGQGGDAARGIAYAFAATVIAAAGNLVSMRLQRDALPLPGTVAWGMAYGAAVAALAATLAGDRWSFDASLPYIASLAHLALFGSVVAFLAYLSLLKAVGAGPASFVGVSTPVVALVLSTFFEAYHWTWAGALGLVLAVAGNFVALSAGLRTAASATRSPPR